MGDGSAEERDWYRRNGRFERLAEREENERVGGHRHWLRWRVYIPWS